MTLLLAYFIAGYWAVGQTIYANKVVFYSSGLYFFMKKLLLGIGLGWILIPVAVIKKLFHISGNLIWV